MDVYADILLAAAVGLGTGAGAAWAASVGLRRWAAHADEARRRAELLLGHLPSPVVALDKDGRILAANPAAEELWGAPIPQGLDWEQFLRRHPWLDQEGVRVEPAAMPLLRALRTDRSYSGDGRISRPGLPPLAVLVRTRPLHDRLRHPMGILATFEPRLLPEAVRDEGAGTNVLPSLSDLPFALMVTRGAGHHVAQVSGDWNSFGQPRVGVALARSPMAHHTPAWLRLADQVYQSAREYGNPSWPSPDGERFFLLQLRPWQGSDHQVRGLIWLLQERTAETLALRSAERSTRLLNAMWDALPDIVLVVEAGGQIAGLNSAARRLFGVLPGQENSRDAAGLVRALGLRGFDGQPLPPRDWLPLRVLAGESGGEELLLVETPAGETLILVARAVSFADPLDAGQSFVLWVAQPAVRRQEAVTAGPLRSAN